MADGMTTEDRFAPLPPNGKAASSAELLHEIWEPELPAPIDIPEGLKHYTHGAPTHLWRYRNGKGALLMGIARFDKSDGGKEVLPLVYGRRVWTTRAGNRQQKIGWQWKGLPAPRPLYGLDRLAARADAPVLLVEGEKAADAAQTLFPDHVAMTWPGGGNAVEKADWSPLRGRSVTIWPDADEAGRKAATAVARALNDAGATGAAVVTVPASWPKGWDLADDLPKGVSSVDTLADMLAGAGQEEEQAETIDREAEIERLAKLSALDYQLERRQAAQRLGLGAVALDKAAAVARRQRRAEAAAAHRAEDAPGPGETRWPYGVVLSETGLHADAGDAGLIWVCAPLDVLGEARDATGEGWGLWLRWKDRDGRNHTWPMSARLLMVGPGELEAALVERGLRVSPDSAARMHLRRALGEVQCGSRVTLISRAGWHTPAGSSPAYVLPDGSCIGHSAEALVMSAPSDTGAQMVAQAGTLGGWQADVAAAAAGNDVPAFSLCAGFAGPLLEPLGEPSGGVHFAGRSKVGKTLALRLALSVWGLPFKGGALRDWRSTANGLEGTAEEAGDGLLGLDELHQADPREVAAAVYMLANESGKGRMKRDTTAARRRTWRTFILSTGELDITSMVAKAGQKLPAGAEVRLPSVPVPSAGIWPNLHGAATAEALMTRLHGALRRQHGTAGRAFIEHLLQVRVEEPQMLHDLARISQEEMQQDLPADADAQVKDVARRFALIALAGELATVWGILPWPEGEARRAAKAMFAAWISKRGTAASSEETQHVRALRLFLLEHGPSRFVGLVFDNGPEVRAWVEANPDRPVIKRAGWRRRLKDGRDEFLIPPEVWREICADASIDPTEAARTMAEQGFLARDGKNLTKVVRLPGMPRLRVYIISPDMLDEAIGEGK